MRRAIRKKSQGVFAITFQRLPRLAVRVGKNPPAVLVEVESPVVDSPAILPPVVDVADICLSVPDPVVVPVVSPSSVVSSAFSPASPSVSSELVPEVPSSDSVGVVKLSSLLIVGGEAWETTLK